MNSLSCLRYTDDFGRQETYQLTIPEGKKGLREQIPLEHRGRLLFSSDLSYAQLNEMLSGEFVIKKTKLTKEFGYAEFQIEPEHSVVPLFIIKGDGTLKVWTAEDKHEPKPEETIMSLVRSV